MLHKTSILAFSAMLCGSSCFLSWGIPHCPSLAPSIAVAAPVAEQKVQSQTQTQPSDSYGQKWGGQVIYFIMTDRFFDGDPSNNRNIDKSRPGAFHGGDLRGIIDKLDYLKGLGTTAIWITPIYSNIHNVKMGRYLGHGYHGYWIKDHYLVDESFGTLDTAKELVSEAHRRNIRVILDIVLNHVGPNHAWTRDPEKKTWLHNAGRIKDWDNIEQIQNGDLFGLPDLNQDNPETYRYLLNNTLWWIKETGIDGIRLDAVKHINHQFWQSFCQDIKKQAGADFMLLGEAWLEQPHEVASYQRDGIPSLVDMPLYYAITETLACDGSTQRLTELFAADKEYPHPERLVTFIDNHDVPRFLASCAKAPQSKRSQQKKIEKLKLALDLIFTCRGIPCVYYGTEAALDGGYDPVNRADMPFDASSPIAEELQKHLIKLNGIRSAYPALQRGEQKELFQDGEFYSFLRRQGTQEVITVLNNSYWPLSRLIPLKECSSLTNGTVLVDVLSQERFTAKDGALQLSLPGKAARILVPQSSLIDEKKENNN